ncbi:MAG: ABC transporter permease subunit [Candidatus Bathyarchaeota archaeon]|jgi:ABC-type transport system involved in multi-copper enzyme maturation permease subunit
MRVFLKNLQKGWKGGVITPLFVSMIVPLIAGIWPSFKEQAASFAEILKNPIYQALLGQMGLMDITTWQGIFYMYVGICMEWAIVFIAILIPARIVAGEVDKNTLDVTLSYPIPRWRYLLEKYIVYLIYSSLYPAFVYVLAVVNTNSLGESLDMTVLGYSMIGFWLWLFALGALSLLCGTLFLESNRALSASGILIVAQYVMTRLGELGDLSFLKDFSLFNYLSTGSILQNGGMILNELAVVLGVGVAALAVALYVFQTRELAY